MSRRFSSRSSIVSPCACNQDTLRNNQATYRHLANRYIYARSCLYSIDSNFWSPTAGATPGIFRQGTSLTASVSMTDFPPKNLLMYSGPVSSVWGIFFEKPLKIQFIDIVTKNERRLMPHHDIYLGEALGRNMPPKDGHSRRPQRKGDPRNSDTGKNTSLLSD